MSDLPKGASPTGDGDSAGVWLLGAPPGLDVVLSSLGVCNEIIDTNYSSGHACVYDLYLYKEDFRAIALFLFIYLILFNITI